MCKKRQETWIGEPVTWPHDAQYAVKPNIRFIIPAKSQGVFSLPFQRILQGFYSPE